MPFALRSSLFTLLLFVSCTADAQSGIVWVWSGAVTPSGARLTVRSERPGDALRLVVSEQADLSAPVFTSDETRADAASGVARFEVEGLTPGTPYRYGVEVNGRLDPTSLGRFRTYDKDILSFRIATASCARTDSDHPVFRRIAALQPDLFLHLGDFHYENLGRNDPAVFYEAYRRQLTAPAQAALFRSVPTAYVWDDHDYGPNNSDRRSPSRQASRRAYRATVPHYDLAEGDGPLGDGDAPIYHAFSAGRVRFILLDTRSERDAATEPDGPQKTMLGETQQRWLEQELLAARDNFALTILVSGVPWIADDGGDRWSNYTFERAEIAAFIVNNGIRNLIMVSGDGHMLAFDDGTNNRYGPGGGPGFPVLQAGALDRPGSIKGGPYTTGPFPNRDNMDDGQFALIEVDDQGGDLLCVAMTGHRQTGDAPRVEQLFRQRRCFSAPDRSKRPAAEAPPVPGERPFETTLSDETAASR